MTRRFVVEADGGSRGNPGPAGYGAVVRDGDTGELLVETAEFLGTVTNNVAEYRGLIAGLRAAHAVDPEGEVAVRMDSKLVVEQMSGRWQVKHPDMKPLAAEARSVFPAGRVAYQWIPRNENKHADRLANEAMDAGRRGAPWQPRPRAATGAAREPAEGAARAEAGARHQPASAAGVSAPAETGAKRRASAAGASGPVGRGSAARPDEVPSAPSGAGAARVGAGPSADQLALEGDGFVDAPSTLRSASPTATHATHATRATRAEGAGPGAGRQTRDAGPTPAPAEDGAGTGTTAPPDLGTPTTFLLLRHGETALTPERRFSGSGGSDPDLSPVGRRQAELVAEALAARGTVQAVVSSPLARCRQTAEVVAARLGIAEVRVDHDLRETDFGAFEGLTFAEAKQQHPAALDAWLASTEVAPPGGESLAAVARRVGVARDRLLARYAGRTVLLVSHVSPIKTLVRLALGAPPEALFRMDLSAASLSSVQYYADGNASLRLLNETSYLRR